LSGPAPIQISSYWQPGEAIHINLFPENDFAEELSSAQKTRPKIMLKTWLAEKLPKRLVDILLDETLATTPLHDLSQRHIKTIANDLHQWQIKPNATEGYRTAEVTLGGVDCDALSSKTFEATNIKGLYFIGEVVDVTGWLGGYNFQWAWSSGWAAGQVV
jgi:predicted Rossmann fold flavoprotein